MSQRISPALTIGSVIMTVFVGQLVFLVALQLGCPTFIKMLPFRSCRVTLFQCWTTETLISECTSYP